MLKAPLLSPRRGYIGGGNAAGILGLSPFKSPLGEFLTITGQDDETPEDHERFFARRKALEPFATVAFEQATGLTIETSNQRYTDSEHSFIRAEIDAEASDSSNLEIKTVHPMAANQWGDSGSDDLPLYVTAQAMHGLMVRPKQYAWVVALIGFDDTRVYRVHRDEEAIAMLRAREVLFWNDHVLPMIQPEPSSLSDVLRAFKQDSGRSVEADESAARAWARIKELAPLVKEQEELKDQLKLYMRDATTLTSDGKALATWKTQEQRRFSEKAFAEAHADLHEQFKQTNSIRVLRIK